MKRLNNNLSNNNADDVLQNATERTAKKDTFHIPVDPSAETWDRTPNTAEEMINTYGTYEIQPTADSGFMFPAISQGLPSENVAEIPEHFHEGVVPKLND